MKVKIDEKKWLLPLSVLLCIVVIIYGIILSFLFFSKQQIPYFATQIQSIFTSKSKAPTQNVDSAKKPFYLELVQASLPEAVYNSNGSYFNVTTTSETEMPIMHTIVALCTQPDTRIPVKEVKFLIDKTFFVECTSLVEIYDTYGSISSVILQTSFKDSDESVLYSKILEAEKLADDTQINTLVNELLLLHKHPKYTYEAGLVFYNLASQNQGTSRESQYLKQSENYQRQTLTIDPFFAPAYASLANVLFIQDYKYVMTPEIIELYAKAQSLDPNWSYAFMNQGVNLATSLNFEAAYPYLLKAVQVNPKFYGQQHVIDEYVCVARRLGRHESAEFYTNYNVSYDRPIAWCQY